MMRNSRSKIRGTWSALLLALLAIADTVSSFGVARPPSAGRPGTRLSATPTPKRFDESYSAKPPVFNKATQLWEPSPETEEAPYGPFGSLLRGGPAPFVLRLTKSADYDQAVFKYMSQTKCSRKEAQGNMDYYFNNAADWAYQKGEEARGRPVVDLAEISLKDTILVIVWALFVTPFLGRCAYLIAFEGTGWGITLDQVFNF